MMIDLCEEKHWEYRRQPMITKNWKKLVDKINVAFLHEVSCTWKWFQDKISKMREKYHEEYEGCNATCVIFSYWSWYEKFHSILGGTLKMIGAVGGIDQGFHCHILKW
jgi:hypothetical protein